MRKILTIAAVLALCVTAAHANVFVGWTAQGGFFWSGSGTGILAGGGSTIAQLIWSPDATASAAGVGGTTTESEMIVDAVTFTENVGGIDQWCWWSTQIVSDDGGANPNGGYIYARIFQDSVIEAGDWVYNGPVVAASNLDPNGNPKPTQQGYNLNDPTLGRGGSAGNEIDGAFSSQVVPEPATLSMLLLGGVVMALRRRRS